MAQVQQVVKTTKMVTNPQVQEDESPQEKYDTKKTIFRVYQGIWYVLGVLETVIALRIFLKASGANPESGFVSFVYGLSQPLISPFSSMFRTVTEGNFSFELSSFVAGIVYLLIATGIVELFQILKPINQKEVEESV